MSELDYILKSLNNIDAHYYKVMGVNLNKNKYQQAAENAFTTELYHQLKINQKDYSEVELFWHFDLNKERAFSIRPDLVLHKSPDNRDVQKIYIEIKTNKNTQDIDLENDLKKLLNAVSENNSTDKLGFEKAFYILGNIDIHKKKQIFQDIFKNEQHIITDKITIIKFDSNKYTPASIILKDFLKTY